MPRKKPPDNSKPLSVEQARGKIAKAMRAWWPVMIRDRLRSTQSHQEGRLNLAAQARRLNPVHQVRTRSERT